MQERMTRSGLFGKHLPLAYKIASRYWIPGGDREDVRQEARIGLWIATQGYDPAKGSFRAFAKVVVERRLQTCVKVANRHYERPVELLPEMAVTEDRPSELPGLFRALGTLSERERQAVTDHLNGVAARSSRSHDNALTRARKKLREAA